MRSVRPLWRVDFRSLRIRPPRVDSNSALGFNAPSRTCIDRGSMTLRLPLTMLFAVYFACLVPLALACEVSAQGTAGCAATTCAASDRAGDCTAARVMDASTLCKIDWKGASRVPVLVGLHAATASPGIFLQLPRNHRARRLRLMSPPPLTPVGLADQLRI
jgi:hypothetical protein